MKTSAIKYADLLTLADQCRTRPGSEWIDTAKLAAMLAEGDHATNIKATAPDNITEAIAQAQKSCTERVKTLEEVAKIFGVVRKTLANWKKCYNIQYWKRGGYYYLSPIIDQLQQFTQKEK